MSRRPAGASPLREGTGSFGYWRFSRVDQHDRGFVAVFRQAGDIVHGLVEQHGDQCVLAAEGVIRQGDFLVLPDAGSQGVHHDPIHPDQAVGDEPVGLPARTQSACRHQLGQADFAHMFSRVALAALPT